MIRLPSNIVHVTLIARFGFVETTWHPRFGLSDVPYTAGERLLSISGFIHVPNAQNLLESRLVLLAVKCLTQKLLEVLTTA